MIRDSEASAVASNQEVLIGKCSMSAGIFACWLKNGDLGVGKRNALALGSCLLAKPGYG
jgi:hypothetical protein